MLSKTASNGTTLLLGHLCQHIYGQALVYFIYSNNGRNTQVTSRCGKTQRPALYC